jgi:hypothetical protein
MQKEKILWDDLSGTDSAPVYSGGDGSVCKTRYYNGRYSIWVDYFPDNGRIYSNFMNKPFCVADAIAEVNRCLEDYEYLIVSFKHSNCVRGILGKEDSSFYRLLSLSIIGLDNLYLGDDYIKVPSWYSDNSTAKVEQEILPPKTIYALVDDNGELCESCYANYQDALAGAVNGSWVCSYNLSEGFKGKD